MHQAQLRGAGTYIVWGIGLAVASIILAAFGASVPSHPLRVVALLLTYVADFASLCCFVVAAWKALQNFRAVAEKIKNNAGH